MKIFACLTATLRALNSPIQCKARKFYLTGGWLRRLGKGLAVLAAIGGAMTNAQAVTTVTLTDYISGGTGSPSDPYSWVDDAIAAAQSALGSAGGIIAIPDGYYKNRTQIQLNSNIVLSGSGTDRTFLVKWDNNPLKPLILATGSNCVFRNITFDGNRTTTGDVTWGTLCLKISGSNYLVDHCRFQETYGSAIYLGSNTSDVTIQYCKFYNNDRSVWQHNERNYRNITVRNNDFSADPNTTKQYAASSFDNPLILPIASDMNLVFDYNTCSSWKFGFCFAKSANAKVRFNTFTGSPWNANFNQCIHLEDQTNDVDILGNNCDVYTQIGGQCITLQKSNNIRIFNNYLRFNSGESIKGEHTKDITVQNNQFVDSNLGVFIWTSATNTNVNHNWFKLSGTSSTDVSLTGTLNSVQYNSSYYPFTLQVPSDTGTTGNSQQSSPDPTYWTPIVYPPEITSASSVSGTPGAAFNYQITGTNNPVTYSATGLPPGLSVNAGSGLISGTPSSAGTWVAYLTVSNTLGKVISGTGSQLLVSSTLSSGAFPLVMDISRTATWRGAVSGTWNSTSANWGTADSLFHNSDDAYFDDTASLTAVVAATGSIQPRNVGFSNNAAAYTLSGSLAPAGILSQSGAGTLTVSANLSGACGVLVNSGSMKLSGNNSYVGLTQVNSGTLTIAGNNTGDGQYRVDGGTLEVAGNVTGAGTVNVNNGGLLIGTGTVGEDLSINSGGTIAPGPGGGFGDLNLGGNLTMQGSSNLQAQVGNGVCSQLAGSGVYTPPASGQVAVSITAPPTGFWPGVYEVITGAPGLDANNFFISSQPSGTNSFQLASDGGVLSLIAKTAPRAPAWLVCYSTNSQLALSWAPSTLADSYNVYRMSTSGTWSLLGNTTDTSYVDGAVASGTYSVSAYINGCGEGGRSPLASGSVVSLSGTSSWAGAATSGTWSNAANWGGSIPPANAILAFGASNFTTLTNNLGAGFNVGGMSFNSGASAFTINGNSTTLAGDIVDNATNSETVAFGMVLNGMRTITVNAGTLSLTGTLSDGGAGYGLTKNGLGSLTLSSPNTFAGLAIDSGTLTLANAAASGRGGITLGDTASGATASATLLTSFSGTNSASINLGSTSGALTLGNKSANTATFSGSLALNGHNLTLSTQSTGSLNWVSTNGSSIAGSGTLIFKSGSSGGFTFTNSSAGTMNFKGDLLNQGTGTGAVLVKYSVGSHIQRIIEDSATSTLTLYGGMANYYGPYLVKNGNLQIQNGVLGTGTVTLGDPSTGSAGASLTLNGASISNSVAVASATTGTLSLRLGTSSSQIYSGTLLLNHDLQLIGYSGASLTLTGQIVGANNLISSGPGSVVMSGSNSAFTGDVLVSSGTLKAGATTAFSQVNMISVADGAAFDLNGKSVTIEGLSDVGGGSAGMVTQSSSSAATLTLAGSGSYAYNGSILPVGSNPLSLAVNLNPGGAQTLSGSNNYSGTTTISGGTLVMSGTNTGASAYTIKGPGSLDLTGALSNPAGAVSIQSGGALTGTGAIAGVVTVSAGGAISPGDGAGGALSISGPVTLNPQANLNFTAGVQTPVLALTGSLTASSGTGASYVNISSGAGFGAGTYTLLTAAAPLNPGCFVLRSAPAGYACSLTASGNSLLLTVRAAMTAGWQTSASSPLWSNAANWGGTAPISGDSLAFGSSNQTSLTNDIQGLALRALTFNSGASAYTLSGSSIFLSGTIRNASSNPQSIRFNITLTAPVTIETGTGQITINGVLRDYGLGYGVTKTGNGLLILTAVNSFSGGVSLNSGTLALGSDTQANEEPDSLGSGPIALNAGALRLGGSNGVTYDFSNDVMLNGGSIEAVAGDQHFGGTFIVSGTAGNLIRSGTNSSSTWIDGLLTGTGPLTVSPFNLSGTCAGALFITNSTGTNDYSGTVTILSQGGLFLSSDGSNPDNAGGALAGAAIVNNSSGNAILPNSGIGFDDGVVSGTFGSLSGSGALLLKSTDDSGVTLAVGANNADATYSGAISSGGANGGLTKIGTGSWTLQGANNYSGDTSIQSGSLVIAGTNSGSGTIDVASGASLSVNGIANSSALTVAGILCGSGTITAPVVIQSGGSILPGDDSAAATLRVIGSLQLNGGSMLNMNLGAPSDSIALTGSYSGPASGTVTINFGANDAPGIYNLITGAAGISASSFQIGTTTSGLDFALSATNGTLSVAISSQTPQGLASVGWNNRIDLSWSPSLLPSAYDVERWVGSGTATVWRTGTSPYYVDSTAQNGVTYNYAVRAVSAGGTSSYSTPICAAPGAFGSTAWSGVDIGSVGVSGSSFNTSGNCTVIGSGSDIYGLADGFRFYSQPLVGDGMIEARVDSITNTDPYAKAGVMIRETLSNSSKFMGIFVKPSTGISAIWRTATSGACGAAGTSGTTGYSVRVARSGSTFSTSYSVDGVQWTGTTTQTISMSGTVNIGLAVCSHKNTALCTGSFSHVNILPGDDWDTDDVGSPTLSGFTDFTSSNLTIEASGSDIGGTSDQFRYAATIGGTNCSISARVGAVEYTDPAAKAGLMIRDSWDPGAPYIAVLVTAGNGIVVQQRSAQNGTTMTLNQPNNYDAPYFIKLTRTGGSVTILTSSDGITWQSLQSITYSFGSTPSLGVVATSHDNTTLGAASFDNIIVTP